MKKIFLILVSIYLCNTFLFEAYGKREQDYNYNALMWEIEGFHKNNPEMQADTYTRYSWEIFNRMDFNEAIKVIDELTLKYPDNRYIDDCQWLKGMIYKYYTHQYKDFIDVYVNLAEKHDGVKFEVMQNKLSPWSESIPKELTKKELDEEIRSIKESFVKIEKLKDEINEKKNKDNVNEVEIIDKYLEIGNIWRTFYDFENTEKNYTEGVKEFPDNLNTAKLFYELGEIYSKDVDNFTRLPLNRSMWFEDRWKKYDYKNDAYKKALGYYLEVYKKYPKSDLAPKALEEAAHLYQEVGYKWVDYSDEVTDVSHTALAKGDYQKAAETYELIRKEYPGYDGMKRVLGKLGGTLEKLKAAGIIVEIDYWKKKLELDKEYYKEAYEKMKSENKKDDLEILLEKAEIYKQLYGEYPKITIEPSEPKPFGQTIKNIDDMINMKQEKKD